MRDPTTRFTDRVDNYVKYRPHYPKALPDVLGMKLGFSPAWSVADIGSGTGISSEVFLDAGCLVYGVEPNRAMREAAETIFAGRRNFISVDGRAEATSLGAASIDLYVAGQSFHWFERAAARLEALRILKAPKPALLMWNDWQPSDSPFLRDYDALLRARMPQRSENDHRNLVDRDFDIFFGEGHWERLTLPNPKRLDFDALKGRLLSASYAPKEGDPGYEETVADLADIFARHARDGEIEFAYTTILYVGRIAD